MIYHINRVNQKCAEIIELRNVTGLQVIQYSTQLNAKLHKKWRKKVHKTGKKGKY